MYKRVLFIPLFIAVVLLSSAEEPKLVVRDQGTNYLPVRKWF